MWTPERWSIIISSVSWVCLILCRQPSFLAVSCACNIVTSYQPHLGVFQPSSVLCVSPGAHSSCFILIQLGWFGVQAVSKNNNCLFIGGSHSDLMRPPPVCRRGISPRSAVEREKIPWLAIKREKSNGGLLLMRHYPKSGHHGEGPWLQSSSFPKRKICLRKVTKNDLLWVSN